MSRRCPGRTRWRRNSVVARAARRGGQPGPLRTPPAAATVYPGRGRTPGRARDHGQRVSPAGVALPARPAVAVGRQAEGAARQARLCGGVRAPATETAWSPAASGTVGASLRRRWSARPWKRPQPKDEQCRPGLGRRGCRSARQRSAHGPVTLGARCRICLLRCRPGEGCVRWSPSGADRPQRPRCCGASLVREQERRATS